MEQQQRRTLSSLLKKEWCACGDLSQRTLRRKWMHSSLHRVDWLFSPWVVKCLFNSLSTTSTSTRDRPYFGRSERASLIDQDVCKDFNITVEPTGIVFRHVDAAMRTLGREDVAAGVLVRKLRSGAVIGAPPAVVHKVAVAVILHGKVDGGAGIPILRRLWHSGLKDGRRLFPFYPPFSRRAWLIGSPCRHQEGVDQLAVLLYAHTLFCQ